ncbi:tail fiber assembly protein [Pseudomonas sp. URMO17WK12:I2]|uniref:tail fiber assembly protein n=1 Tax=Pseudomonas sp. URMO17WK12:I2 TaxID=1261623 RepID=UPI000DB7953D|nr:tail fiber assembly protein [Pseudomonas sp. URMO17WK12:I2]PZW46383.1 virus tail fiber assembly protein lambda gpK [Pseudomonas sp. URMO17WK12:I2]
MEATAPVIYHYHPQTGELLGTGLADPDPMNPANWLVPGFATLDAPDEPAQGIVPCRVEHARWELLEDNRGTVFSTDSGQPLEYTSLGPLPQGFTTQARPSLHHTWQGASWVFDEQSARAAFINAAVLERNSLQAEATARIAPLQDAADFEDATEAEISELEAWKRYRIALNRLPLQDSYPNPIQWPKMPS